MYCRAGQQNAQQQTHVRLVAAADGSADLKAKFANRQGTGFVVTDDSDEG